MIMSKRPAGILILCAILAAAALAPVGAGGKGKGQKGGQIQVKIKISGEFADFPLPFTAEPVAKNRQKAARGWTEYRVIGFSAGALGVFYRTHMPRHGWRLGHHKGNTWVWRRGRRSITLVFIQIGPFSLIQVRERG